jgi:hypothetical protein
MGLARGGSNPPLFILTLLFFLGVEKFWGFGRGKGWDLRVEKFGEVIEEAMGFVFRICGVSEKREEKGGGEVLMICFFV